MQTANPVLARIDRDAAQASRSGAGFAYEEGRSAVASAQFGAAAPEATPAPAPVRGAGDAGIYTGVQIPAPAGPRVTYAAVMVKSALLFGIAAFTAVSLSVGVVFELVRRVAESGLPLLAAVQVLVLRLPGFLVLSFPMATLMATLLAFSRLSGSSELTA
ncbi:MAG: LptF/LptG family permease, partial [Phycisphaerales bacterium]